MNTGLPGSTLIEQLTEEARRVLPGLRLCGPAKGGLSSVSDELLRYVVALLGGAPLHPAPDASQKEWMQLLVALFPHWVIPLLYHRIGSLPASFSPPKEIMDRLRLGFLRSRIRAVQMDAQLREILEAFGKQGIPLLVLKGPALARTVYPDAAARPSSDLDLLVHPETMAKAREIMIGLGYSCQGKQYEVARQIYSEELFVPGPSSPTYRWVEVHWDLTEVSWSGREQRLEGLFERAVRVDTAEADFLALSPVDALIHRVLNNAWRHYRDLRLIWICDVALLARHLTVPDEWSALQDRCDEWRCRRALEWSLRLAQAWTDFRLPTGFDDASTWQPTSDERAIWVPVTSRHEDLLSYLRLVMLSSADKRELLRASLHLLFPDRAWMRLKYPPADGWRLPDAYARRWWRWISKGFR